MVSFVLSMELLLVKEEWRSALTSTGELFVMTTGLTLMLMLCVNS